MYYIFYVLLVAVQSSVAMNKACGHEAYIEKVEHVIFEQKCFQICRVLDTVVSTELQT